MTITKPTPLQLTVEGLLSYWTRKLLPRIRIDIKSDDRFTAHMITEEVVADKHYRLMYHTSNITEWRMPMVISGVFHEIGHIKCGWKGENNASPDDAVDECLAERYSLDMVSKYYPSYLPIIRAHVRDKMCSPDWISKYPSHFIAYSNIKEYAI